MPMMPDLLLPSAAECQRRAQALAVLDAVLFPAWDARTFRYDAHWPASDGLASMQDGPGAEAFMLFARGGAIFKTFDHERPARDVDLPGLRPRVPVAYQGFWSEPAFTLDNVTCLGWVEHGAWQVTGPVNDNPLLLLLAAPDPARAYVAWAEDQGEGQVSLVAVQAVFDHAPLTGALVALLRPHVTLEALRADLDEIGYPNSAARRS
ncbi:hypothetical protein [Deinococcus maricopensis]|uniref:Uncharacterized protein n=1 Tax=Deinococcus maricopensis (strain DSM 21211 / LMG 22137 / NRRL B-23946 / LB-34) TaxID=709986 RepID=E8UC54_DEIML|nr:hypothetical protein [Deinococcus maricopensis]ADV68715.1 hypothetical protein Deima_3086 [Deinococcus maricopensis DSM 21211]